MIEIRQSNHADVELLAPILRDADVLELEACGKTPQQALEEGLRDSNPAMVVCEDGKPLAMFGVCPCPDIEEMSGVRFGSIWYLGSDEATKDAKRFMRISREWLGRLSEGYDVLGNMVDERNSVHVRWIAAMGFEFTRIHQKFGPHKLPFLEFMQTCSGDN
tara:strand:- start:426 stop:908 length:483 start_codon:yes stop_codon:yes gene_type:complete